MSKTNSFENAILLHIFQNADIAGIGDTAGLQNSVTAGNLYVALFTADPTDTGAVSNEADYTGYARKSVVRSGSGWSVTDDTASNAAAVTFDACSGGSSTVSHFAVCKAGTKSVADILYSGSLTSSLAISDGITAEFAVGALTVTEA